MSTLSVYAVAENGDLERVGEIRNSHRFHPAIWRSLAVKYGVPDPMTVMICGDGNDEIALWSMANDGRLSRADTIVCMATFDGAIMCADTVDVFVAEAARFELEEIAEMMLGNSDARGFAFAGSLSDDPWSVWDEDADEYRPYNIDTDTETCVGPHWFIHEHVPANEG